MPSTFSQPIDAVRLRLRTARRSSLARNAGWMVLGQGGGVLLQAAYFILIARLLGPFEYGLYAGAFALTSIIGQYSAMGSGTVFLRYVTADRRKAPLYWGNILLVTTLASVVVLAALLLISGRVFSPASQSITLLAAIANCFCNQLTASAAKVFQTYERMQITAMLGLATNFMRTLAAAALLMAVHRASAYQWSIATVIVSSIATVASVVAVTSLIGRPALSLAQVRRDLLEGFGFSFATSTATAYNDIDKTMLSHYGMLVANGIYSMAYRVVDVATIPILAIREAAMPGFFRRGAEDGISGAGGLARALMKRSLPLGILAALAIFVSAPLAPHLVGKGFKETVSALRWLCLIPVFRSIHQISGAAITGGGFQRYRTLIQLLAAALNVLLNLWLIPLHGWLGAAWASLGTDAILAVLNSGVLALLYRSRPDRAAVAA